MATLKRIGLVVLAAALLVSCVGALQGGTGSGATYEWAHLVVSVFDADREIVAGAIVTIDGHEIVTNRGGLAAGDVTWKWTKHTPKDESGRDYYDLIVACGKTVKTVRVHPAETVWVEVYR